MRLRQNTLAGLIPTVPLPQINTSQNLCIQPYLEISADLIKSKWVQADTESNGWCPYKMGELYVGKEK